MRKYLPTFADLVDRLTISQMKAIFIQDKKKEYDEECKLIIHDIDLILKEKDYRLTGDDVRAICVVMLANRVIWQNEAAAREGKSDSDKLLKLTHSINGCRNTAKNMLGKALGDRLDFKIDAFAAELIPEFGQWQIWPKE